MVLRLLLILFIAGIQAGHPEDSPLGGHFFDFKIREDANVSTGDLEAFFPPAYLQLRTTLGKGEARLLIDTTWNQLVEGLPPADLPPDSTKLPLPFLFESIDIDFNREDRLESIWLYCNALPVTRKQFERFYQTMETLLGEPDSVKTRKNFRGQRPQEIFVNWSEEGHLLELEIDEDNHFGFGCRLTFYASGSDVLTRKEKSLSPPLVFEEGISAAVLSHIESIDSFLPGEGPAPPASLPSTLAERLDRFSETVYLKDRLSFRTNRYLNELHTRLEHQLEKDFSSQPIPERYAWLLRMAKGQEPGYRKGGTQVGAAAYLSLINDPLTRDFLLEGLQVSLPSGVSKYCAQGIAASCTGADMDEFIQAVAEGSETALTVLWSLPTREQIEELRRKRAALNDPQLQRQLEGCIEIAERHLEP